MAAVAAGGVLALVLAAVAWTQIRQDPGPIPSEITVTPSRTDLAALAVARQDPLAARLREGLDKDPATRALMARAAASPVPVLAPADPALLQTARLFTGDRHYMMVVLREDQIIEIYGTTKAFQSPVARSRDPGAAPAPNLTTARVAPGVAGRVRAQAQGLTNIRTERTEYGIDVTFNRFGAAYNVSFICERQGVAGCTEAEAIAFAADLRLIGGGPQ
tara:strand:+ start:717 stop:1370 length:654 start_codon:yes stop_codon:yes gene_type:complete